MINCQVRHSQQFNDKCGSKVRLMKSQLGKLQEIALSLQRNPQPTQLEETIRRLGKTCWYVVTFTFFYLLSRQVLFCCG